jgi:hypothetical protein
MIRLCVFTMLLLAAVLGCSNETQERLSRIEDRLQAADSLLKLQDRLLPVYARYGTTTSYRLSDFERNKIVGVVYSKHSISKGDRIFLGDDIWDVLCVKVATTKNERTSSVQSDPMALGEPDTYDISTVELLVKFGGKATDPKPQP